MIAGNVLLCPRCGGDCLHHGRVVVANRREQDAPGIHVTVEGLKGTLQPSDDFIGRRDDVRVHLTCEGCGNIANELELVMVQYKGQTLLVWQRV